MRALLIAEKPSLRRSIEMVYKEHQDEIPYDITFMEQRGHLITLVNPSELDESLKDWCWENLPIHPEEYGGWRYKVIKEPKQGKFKTAEERYNDIKDEIKSGNYDFIINAGDPDQEGELLIRIVLSSIGNKLPVKRYWSNDTTKPKILEALKNLKDDDTDPMLTNLLSAAYARQHSDYRFGMNISRAATLKMNTRVACGRVKTPIMSIICKREDEINNFIPKTVYGVKAIYDSETDFTGQLFEQKEDSNEDDEEDKSQAGLIWFDDIDEARDLMDELGDEAKVVKYETKRETTYAPKLFKLATAQIAAGKIGYSSTDTLNIIQSLYEKGYLSYPRTDCEYISSNENLTYMLKSANTVPELQEYIEGISKETINKVRGTKKWVNDKALLESGHSALVPTTKAPEYDNLTEAEQDIYKLVCRQFVAIFLPPLIQDKTLLVTDLDGKNFKSTGKTLVDKGYTTIFGTNFNDMQIPVCSEGENIAVENFEIIEKTSTCPKRYTDADLIAACENPIKYLDDKRLKELGKKLKVGTPATRASIIDELIVKDKYLQRNQVKKASVITPTNIGMLIYHNLKDCDISKVDMTGEWEEKLELIRTGNMQLNDLEAQMKKAVTDMVEEIKNTEMNTITVNENIDICDCPKCGGTIKCGPKSFYCSNWKEEDGGCKVSIFKSICDSSFTNRECVELLKGETIIKRIKKGTTVWNQKIKYNFDDNKTEFIKDEAVKTEYKCPKCGGELKETMRLFSCEKECGFTFWKTVPGGKMLTDKQIERFFTTGNTGVVKGMKSKAGKSFDACIALKEDKTGTEFKFN